MPEARACREAVAGLLASAEPLLAKHGAALPAGQLEATRLRDANQARRAHASVIPNPSTYSLITKTSVVRLACAAVLLCPLKAKVWQGCSGGWRCCQRRIGQCNVLSPSSHNIQCHV